MKRPRRVAELELAMCTPIRGSDSGRTLATSKLPYIIEVSEETLKRVVEVERLRPSRVAAMPPGKRVIPTGRPTSPIQRRLDRRERRNIPSNEPGNASTNEGTQESTSSVELAPRRTGP